jgi:hypothetical protein
VETRVAGARFSLGDGESSLAEGLVTPQAYNEAVITVQTYYRLRKEYGGLK